jgi:two-component system chemotaxis sensor kinase CheA
MSDDPLIQAFFEEAGELLGDFEAGLLRLETTPGDAELLNRIFRNAHTLKGNSAMLGFEDVAHFTHALEDLLDQLRKGQRPVTPRVVDALLASGDVLRALLAAARGGPDAVDGANRDEVLAALRALQRGEEPAATPARAAAPTAPAAAAQRVLYEIELRPAADVIRRGLDPLQVVRDVAALGEVLQVAALTDTLPPLAEMDPESCYLGWRIWLLTTRPRADLDACLEFVAEGGALTVNALPMEDGGPGAPSSAATEAPATERAESSAPSPAAPEGRRAASAGATAEAASIRVPVEKVDRLVNLVGELVITQSMVAQTVSAFTADKLGMLGEAVAQMDRHARELHERIMAVRMLPIKTLFGRFPRLVRDLTAAAGKEAALEVAGEDTELDKTVIERIGDPLTHLVRNAIDHGLETPEERRRTGKTPRGVVRLEAYQQGGNIYIEVADDGKGLDRERILAKGVQNGLVAPDQTPTDEEIFALIFRPGLSTAEKVTEVSGRGVGMDVVRRNVEALGGSIAIKSERGSGTTFRIKLPLTLAIMDGQCLQVGDQLYILPLVAIVESIRPAEQALTTIFDRAETVTVRGQAVPVIRLHELFGVPPRTTDLTEALVVIVEQEGKLAALMVDELLGQQQVVIKSLEHNFQKIDGVAGATIGGDGRVALILDVPGLLALAKGRAHRAPEAEPALAGA